MTVKTCMAALVLAASSYTAHAAPIIFFGENQTNPYQIGTEPAAARAAFLSNLTGVGTEDFEGFSVGATGPLNVLFTGSSGDITATLNGAGQVAGGGSNSVGRFNTSPGGSQWWDTSGQFSLNFDTAISAFGFYGTDIGDFNGQITVALTDTDNNVTNLIINNTVNGIDAANLFWGFIDLNAAYTSITFGNTAAGTDFFGFDDFTIGDRQQITIPDTSVSEPATLAIFAASVFGLMAFRRRQRR